MPRSVLLSPDTIELLVSRHDPDELVDVLRITGEDLLTAFPELVKEAMERGDFPELEDTDEAC